MSKTLLYKLFRIGRIPKKLRSALKSEEIVVSDEGIGGWFITRNLKAPGKRYIHRKEGFTGCLVITQKRILCYTYWKRQINISVQDPKISSLYTELLDPNTLAISFQCSLFHKNWEGVIEFRFKTEKAQNFYDVLIEKGLQSGHARDNK
ncbi:MAG: hypothetical protein R6V04_13050 [bacterium]